MECRACRGSGKVNPVEYTNCSNCVGTGKSVNPDLSKLPTTCIVCGGIGKRNENVYRDCDRCNGTGRIPDSTPPVSHSTAPAKPSKLYLVPAAIVGLATFVYFRGDGGDNTGAAAFAGLLAAGLTARFLPALAVVGLGAGVLWFATHQEPSQVTVEDILPPSNQTEQAHDPAIIQDGPIDGSASAVKGVIRPGVLENTYNLYPNSFIYSKLDKYSATGNRERPLQKISSSGKIARLLQDKSGNWFFFTESCRFRIDPHTRFGDVEGDKELEGILKFDPNEHPGSNWVAGKLVDTEISETGDQDFPIQCSGYDNFISVYSGESGYPVDMLQVRIYGYKEPGPNNGWLGEDAYITRFFLR